MNGTLSEPQREQVATHLQSCAHCTREVAEIESLAKILAAEGVDRPPAVRRPLATAVLAVAGSLILIVLAVRASSNRGGTPAGEPHRIVTLDLGAGGSRGEAGVAATIPAGVSSVELLFGLTPEPGATYTLQVFDPGGIRIHGPEPVTAWDPFGSARARLPASALRVAGLYKLEIEEVQSTGSARRYDYHFTVDQPR